MKIQVWFIVCCTFVIVTGATAEHTSQFLSLVAEYEDTREAVLAELANDDRARKEKHGHDAQAIQQLSTESLELLQDANRLYGNGKADGKHDRARAHDLRALYALKVACDALYQTVTTELQYLEEQQSPFVLTVRAKYEDLLRAADVELKQALAGQNNTAPYRTQDAP